MTIGLVVEFTDEDEGGEVANLDGADRAYMVLVGAAHAGEGIDLDDFLALAADAWESVNEAPPSSLGRGVLQ